MDELKLTLSEHLEELRARLWKVVLAILVLGGLSVAYARELFGVLMAPVLAALPEESRSLVYTSGIEEINVLLTVGLYAGIFLSTPFALYHLWSFVSPGLLPNERRHAGPFVACGTVFFAGGALFCYLVVLPSMFDFLLRPGDVGAVRARIAAARGMGDDAVRLLALGEGGKAEELANALIQSLERQGDGRIAPPRPEGASRTELRERLAQMGRLLDVLSDHADEGAGRRTALVEAVLLRGAAQTLLDGGEVREAAARLEACAAALSRGAGPAALAVWSAERHLAAAKARIAEQEWTRPMLSMREQLSLVLLLEVAFGAIFELPLVMALLAFVGVLKFELVKRYQRHAILGCVAAAAIITPSGDAVNLALMALPMTLCFELGVVMVFFVDRRRAAGHDSRMAARASGP